MLTRWALPLWLATLWAANIAVSVTWANPTNGGDICSLADTTQLVASHGMGAVNAAASLAAKINDDYSVSITVAGVPTFRGIVLWIREPLSSVHLGSWTLPSALYQSKDCTAGTSGATSAASTLQHNSAVDKTDTVFTWIPNQADMGKTVMVEGVFVVTTSNWFTLAGNVWAMPSAVQVEVHASASGTVISEILTTIRTFFHKALAAAAPLPTTSVVVPIMPKLPMTTSVMPVVPAAPTMSLATSTAPMVIAPKMSMTTQGTLLAQARPTTTVAGAAAKPIMAPVVAPPVPTVAPVAAPPVPAPAPQAPVLPPASTGTFMPSAAQAAIHTGIGWCARWFNGTRMMLGISQGTIMHKKTTMSGATHKTKASVSHKTTASGAKSKASVSHKTTVSGSTVKAAKTHMSTPSGVVQKSAATATPMVMAAAGSTSNGNGNVMRAGHSFKRWMPDPAAAPLAAPAPAPAWSLSARDGFRDAPYMDYGTEDLGFLDFFPPGAQAATAPKQDMTPVTNAPPNAGLTSTTTNINTDIGSDAWFDPFTKSKLGSCGTMYRSDDFVVAMNAIDMVNLNACGAKVLVTSKMMGMTAHATLVDTCFACPQNSLLLSKALCQFMGAATDVTIEWAVEKVTMAQPSTGTQVLGSLDNPLRANNYAGYLAIEPDGTTAVFAIAGSQSTSDWLLDAALPLTFDIQSYFPNAPPLSSVHVGFWKIFKAGLPSIQNHINNTLPKYPKVKTVVFTGHSLGAVQQNLNAAYFQPQLAARGYTVKTYAYAPARTVNDVFAKYLSQQPAFADDKFFRIVGRHDLVPRLPTPYAPTFYTHVGTEYFVDGPAGSTSLIYKCPAPSLGQENLYCMQAVAPIELSLLPGHVDYFGKLSKRYSSVNYNVI
ncbi:hypothetical protein HDU93_004706 [Gonapodya sp. JEL0774]|nr:hypothetical protein HDU93_004706 [Gonapodya sp. JEL0774]